MRGSMRSLLGKAVLRAASSLSAVPGDSDLRIAPLLTPLPSSDVGLGYGYGGRGGKGVVDRGGSDLLRSGLGLAPRTRRGVHGSVTAVPARGHQNGGGLTPQEVAKVMDAHLDGVPRCYET